MSITLVQQKSARCATFYAAIIKFWGWLWRKSSRLSITNFWHKLRLNLIISIIRNHVIWNRIRHIWQPSCTSTVPEKRVWLYLYTDKILCPNSFRRQIVSFRNPPIYANHDWPKIIIINHKLIRTFVRAHTYRLPRRCLPVQHSSH